MEVTIERLEEGVVVHIAEQAVPSPLDQRHAYLNPN